MFGSLPRRASADPCQDYWTAAYKCAQGCGPCGGAVRDNGAERRRQQADAAWRELVDRVNDLARQAAEAWNRDDFREAARLYREQQAVFDGPEVQDAIRQADEMAARTDAYEAIQRGDAARARGDFDRAVALYRQAMRVPDYDTAEMREDVANLEYLFVEGRRLDLVTREREERKIRNRPEAENLHHEGVKLLESGDLDAAFAKLAEASALAPNDGVIRSHWFLARANIGLRDGAKADKVIADLESALALDPENQVAQVALDHARSQRDKKPARPAKIVRKAGAPDAGKDLKSVEMHSQRAKASNGAGSGKGFDTPGENAGTLVHPDRSKSAVPVFASTIPAAGKEDPQVQQSLAYYQKLEAVKEDTARKIAAIEEAQKKSPGDAAVVSAQIGTLTNQMNDATKEQAQAKKAVGARLKSLKIEWKEEEAPTGDGK